MKKESAVRLLRGFAYTWFAWLALGGVVGLYQVATLYLPALQQQPFWLTLIQFQYAVFPYKFVYYAWFGLFALPGMCAWFFANRMAQSRERT